MTISIMPQIARINQLSEEAKRNGTYTLAFKTVAEAITQIIMNAKDSATTFPPAPTFEYNQNIPSALVEELNKKQKEDLAEVGISFHPVANGFTRMHAIFNNLS